MGLLPSISGSFEVGDWANDEEGCDKRSSKIAIVDVVAFFSVAGSSMIRDVEGVKIRSVGRIFSVRVDLKGMEKLNLRLSCSVRAFHSEMTLLRQGVSANFEYPTSALEQIPRVEQGNTYKAEEERMIASTYSK